MNQDQVKGVLKDAEGTVQEAAGEAFGSKEQQAKGLVKQVEGQAQKALGDAEEALHDATKK